MSRPEFKNTKALIHIDWDTEIVNPGIDKLTKEELAKHASRAVLGWALACDYLGKSLAGEPADNLRSNTIRMLQYFYGLSRYYHAMVYASYYKEVDISDISEEMMEFINAHGHVQRSYLPVEEMNKVKEIFDNILDEMDKERDQAFPDGGIEETKELFKQCGLETTDPTAWSESGDRDAVAVVHDDVEYNLYLMKSSWHSGMRTLEKAQDETNEYMETITRYHTIVKPIYNYIKDKTGGSIYAMPGGGGQHQVFFGNSDGYIAILYLDLKDTKKNSLKYDLIPQGLDHDELMKDFNMQGIRMVTCESIYGRDEYKNSIQ